MAIDGKAENCVNCIVSFAKEPYKRDCVVQNRLAIEARQKTVCIQLIFSFSFDHFCDHCVYAIDLITMCRGLDTWCLDGGAENCEYTINIFI